MRRSLGTLMLTAALVTPVLTGCGNDDTPTRAEDSGASPTAPASSPSPPSPPSPTSPASPTKPTSTSGPVDFTEVALLSLTAAGGRVSPRATVVDDPGAAVRFAAQFRGDALGNQLRVAVRKAEVAEDQALVASVISIGCDVPPGVAVERLGDGLAIVPLKVTSPLPECLAPVTTVALVAVDASAV